MSDPVLVVQLQRIDEDDAGGGLCVEHGRFDDATDAAAHFSSVVMARISQGYSIVSTSAEGLVLMGHNRTGLPVRLRVWVEAAPV